VKIIRAYLPLVAILAVGAALRLCQIGQAPPGLYRDEAFYGLDALNVLRGEFASFFTANNGREGLFMYLLAPMIAALGRTPEALRMTAALVGIATLGAAYLAGRALFSHRVGVLGAGALAVNFWHLAISRVAYRAITLPLMLCLFVACAAAIRPTNTPRKNFALTALAGLFFGLTFYTYTSGQFVLALAGVWMALWLFNNRAAITKTRVAQAALFVGVALVVMAPLLAFYAANPQFLTGRAGQVSILNPEINHGNLLGALIANMGKAAGMFNLQGDRIWRHNLSLRPVFDVLMGVVFVLGIGVSLWRVIRPPPAGRVWAWAVLLLWLAFFLVPTILAEDTPHYLRAIGALPAVCILAALGLDFLIERVKFKGRGLNIAMLVLLFSGYLTAKDYFGDYVQRDMTAYWLEQQNVALAYDINQFVKTRPAQNLWLDVRLADDNPALRFLSPIVDDGSERIVGSDLTGKPPVDAASPVLLIVDPTRDWTAMRNALPAPIRLIVREGPLAQKDFETAPHRAFISVLGLPVDGAGPRAKFERGIALRSAIAMPTQDGRVEVDLTWATAQPIPDDLAVFVHYVRGGQVISQHDGTPADGYLPMPAWRVGDEIVDKHLLSVPGGIKPGDEIRLGIYTRGTNSRLKLSTGSDQFVFNP